MKLLNELEKMLSSEIAIQVSRELSNNIEWSY